MKNHSPETIKQKESSRESKNAPTKQNVTANILQSKDFGYNSKYINK